jgi:hypothetical protein
MRIALCLYGYFNNRADGDAGNKGCQYISEHVFKAADGVDVFVHSWDVENSGRITDLYKPKDCLFEKQVDFNPVARDAGIDEDWINEGFDRGSTMYHQCTIHNSLSFYYSRMKSIELKLWNEKTNGFEYDCVIAARFDLGHRSKAHIGGYNVSLMPFDPKLDMNFIYSAMWMQMNAGYADQWFFSNSGNMDLLGVMYERALNEYFQKDSEYCRAITDGWFDSNHENEFSNEFFRKDKLAIRYKYPRWQMINNHILHKWHLYKTGLYDKSKFI